MRLYLPKNICFVVSKCLMLLLGLTFAVQTAAAGIGGTNEPLITSVVSATNPCGLTPPVLTPAATTVTVGSGPVSLTATGCPGGIIQYFGSAGVYTVAPGGTISVPTSATGTMVVSALCSFSGCTSDVAVATVLVKPASNPSLVPVVSNSIGTQTATVGSIFVYSIPANTFSDPLNDKLTLTATGLPDGLFFNGTVIIGAPTTPGTSPVTIIATNSSNNSTSTAFSLIISAAPGGPTDPFSITSVSTVSCATLTPTKKRITFNPQYAGLTGQPVTFSVYNEFAPTTNPGPYTLDLYTDNSTILLQASQAGSAGTVSFSYNWLAACPPPTLPFAITAVTTVSCTTLASGQRQIKFNPQYAGLTGQPISFYVFNELPSTTAPGPYTLNLFPDNPVINLEAVQLGTPGVVSFSYNWLAACGISGPNTAPTVANAIAPQSATVGQPFTFVIPSSTFADNETPSSGLTLSVTGLPAGLSFTPPATISGIPSTTVGSPFSVTVKATDPGSLSVATTFALTVYPAPLTAPFAITGVTTVSCLTVSASQRTLTFTPRYSGLTGQPVTFAVVNETSPTTNPGPYTLTTYTDNPVFTLQAIQGNAPTSFSYNWLAACGSSGPNTAPTVANAIAPQSATVSQPFTFVIPSSSFVDNETPSSGLTLGVKGLPAGLSFTPPATISGIPSTTVGSPFSVTVKATDPGSLSVATTFALTVYPAPLTAPFAITGVTTVSCLTVSASQRTLTFTPRYSGLTGQPVTFAVVNETSPTTNPGPYTLTTYTDNPVFTLQASQAGTPGTSNFTYNWLAACNSGGARRGAEAELSVLVLGNPTSNETVDIEIRGASGQSLLLQTIDSKGHSLSSTTIEQAGNVERATIRLGHSTGLYFLQATTPTQKQVVKLIKQ